jgi:Ca2+-binding EF-hand superfamily protein
VADSQVLLDGYFDLHELDNLMTQLNDEQGPTDLELAWVVDLAGGDLAGAHVKAHGGVERFRAHRVHMAIQEWYPAQVLRTAKSSKAPPAMHRVNRLLVGEARRALVAQYEMYKHEARHTLEVFCQQNGRPEYATMNRAELESLMISINKDCPDSPVDHQAVDYVLLMAGVEDEKSITPMQLCDAVANWKTLRHKHAEIEAQFNRYDVSKTGTLDAAEILTLLQELNDVKCMECTHRAREGEPLLDNCVEVHPCCS